MAEGSAIASMAAHKQGKFFEMVDKLYADTRKQDKATLEGYAKAIGLDIAGVEGRMQAASVRRMAAIVDSRPREAAAVLKSWLGDRPS